MSHWWRAYDHSVDNAKLQRLSGEMFKVWYNLCCLSSANDGELPALNDVAFKLRISETKARNVIETLQQAKFVDEENGVFRMHEWNEYQYKSDVSTERVKRFRERNINAETPVSETASETFQSSSLKRNGSVYVSSLNLTSTAASLESKEDSAEQASGRKKQKTQLPADFKPDREMARSLGWSDAKIDNQFVQFVDSAKAHNRVYADWQAAWRNWCRSPFQPEDKNKSGTMSGMEGII